MRTLERILASHLNREAAMRMRETYAGCRRRGIDVSINEGLLEDARLLDIDLSATLERALMDEIRKRKSDRWQADNGEAIAAYNERVGREGVFSAMFRKR